MATEIEIKQRACAKCGAGIRENTAFCYKCGTQVVDEDPPKVFEDAPAEPNADENTRNALDDLAARLKETAKEDKQLAKAAGERRRARISQKKAKSPVWEPDESSPALLLILVTAMAVGFTIFVVYFTAIAK